MQGKEKVEQYLNQMKFKKKPIGGVDEEDVLMHIEKICGLFHEMQKEEKASQEVLESAQKEREEAQEELKKALSAEKKAQNELEELRRVLKQKQDETEELRAELGKTQGELEKAKQSGMSEQDVERLRELKQKYEAKYQELVDTMDTIQSMKNDAIVKAKVEAAQEASRMRSEIMERTEAERRQAEAEMQQIKREVSVLQGQKREIQQDIQEQRGQWLSSMERIISHMESIRGQLEAQTRTIPIPVSGKLGDI